MEVRRLPRIKNLVVVQVAETLEARQSLMRSMLMWLAVLEIALLALASLLVPIGVRWGLAPLTRLRRAIDAHLASDFTPLPLEDVPRELQDLVKAFNVLLARLESAAEGTRRFTADASHQMRTPLSVLRTHIGVLKSSRIDSPKALESLADIEAAADRLQRLLVQLLALARAEGVESSGATFKKVDIGAAARAVAEEYALASSRAGLDLRFSVEGPEPLLARGDEILIRELIGNLVDNAIRYNKAGGSVAIHVTGTDRAVSVEVEDDGPGIPAAEREKVFTRFYRLDRDQSRPGSGLGLSIVRVLGQILNAEVTLTDGRDGSGLSVRIVFRG
jgi:two-component system, OmpR family, sensor histidine kinase TctE